MRDLLRCAFLILPVSMGMIEPSFTSSEVVGSPPPEICALSVTRDARSGSAVITWSGGTPPFEVLRADASCFGKASEIKVLASSISGHRYVDVGVLRMKRRFWYQIYDSNSGPIIWSVTQGDAPQTDPDTIHPDDPDKCGDNESCRGKPRSPMTWR